MKTFSTASTRPRRSAGVTSGTSVTRMNTLTASAPDSTAIATNATAKLVVAPSTIVPTPNTADGDEQHAPDVAGDRAPGERDRRDRAADAAGGPQPAQPDGADAEPLLGDGGQQRDRAAEQHGEQVERDRAEQHGLVADEAQPLERVAQPGPGGCTGRRVATAPSGALAPRRARHAPIAVGCSRTRRMATADASSSTAMAT